MELQNISEVNNFYKNMNSDKHMKLYNIFNDNSEKYNDGILKKHFFNSQGYGELAFSWNWYLLVNEMNLNFNFFGDWSI